jgi:1,4-alpha-glucan branching enzyme
MRGFLCLVLHAHLPFVRHPEHERSLEEQWLFEAIAETYLPLVRLPLNLSAFLR